MKSPPPPFYSSVVVPWFSFLFCLVWIQSDSAARNMPVALGNLDAFQRTLWVIEQDVHKASLTAETFQAIAGGAIVVVVIRSRTCTLVQGA